ncbi:site-specific integrase [Bradyrhizobium prioriisuperbiae]|uniref:tyrosine-type recombinase/integrase n=1 Tax=Bradyrhizobium prioriisuperbiae TaxID=2854389 RepID=UPI0028E6C1F1|nr:site-specific integrase [Bradyrhizobium prioritasuperba]
MPRRSAGPRLWFDKKRGTWTIIDGRGRRRTGFRAEEIGAAQKALGDYIASQHVIKDSDCPFISDVLTAYADEHLAGKLSEQHVLYDIRNLTSWWGAKPVSDITAANCRAYVKHRKAKTCARRELAFLNAAVKHWHKEHGPLKVVPIATLPPAPAPRSHWMTRQQAAAFLWQARKAPYLARFFIIGWYTGSRRSVIAGLRWSMVDFKTGIMLRKMPGARQAANKKAPPMRMGKRLMAHLKRWKRLDGKKADYIVTFRGKPIRRPEKSWERARRDAKLPIYITPHILRHTRATNMMQQRKDPWESAKALGMSLDMLTKVYGHHHPDWQKDVSETR